MSHGTGTIHHGQQQNRYINKSQKRTGTEEKVENEDFRSSNEFEEPAEEILLL
jgi:hypothetical protein